MYRCIERGKHGSIPIIESHAYNLLVHSKYFEDVKAMHISKLSSTKLKLSDYHCVYVSLGQYFFELIKDKVGLIKKFKSFHLWFDDICVWKLTVGGYKQHKGIVMDGISSVLCPREPVAIELNKLRDGLANYVPWSIPYRLYDSKKKSKKISILIDWDLRPSACKIESYLPLINGVKDCKKNGIDIMLYTRSDKLIKRLAPIKVNNIGRLPYSKFIELQNKTWIYASGIDGSYEFSVMESQILGNYVFSLSDKVNNDLFLEGETGFVINSRKKFVECIEWIVLNTDPDLVHESAKTTLFNRGEVLRKIETICLSYE